MGLNEQSKCECAGDQALRPLMDWIVVIFLSFPLSFEKSTLSFSLLANWVSIIWFTLTNKGETTVALHYTVLWWHSHYFILYIYIKIYN